MGRGPRRRRRAWRTALWLAAVLAVAVAAGVWFWRDLPRRKVETALEQRLDAKVELGALSILGTRSFILHDLVIRRMSSQPRLARLWIGTLYVTGSLGDILDGRFESLRAVDLEARLAPVAERPPPPEPGAEPLEATVDRLVIEKGRLVLGADEKARPEDVVLGAEGSLTGVGGSLAGEIRLQSKQIGLTPLFQALVGPGPAPLPGGRWPEGTIDGFGTEVRISEEGRRIEATPRAERIVLVKRRAESEASSQAAARASTLTVPRPEAAILVHQEAVDGPLRVEVHPKLSFIESASLEARFQARSWELAGLEADVRGLDLDPVLTFLSVLPEGWDILGKADFEAHGNGEAVEYTASARVPRASARFEESTLQIEGITLSARGRVPLVDGEHAGATPAEETGFAVVAKLDVASASGSIGGHDVPPSLLPLQGTFAGRLLAGKGLAFEGKTVVTTPSAGILTTEGSVTLPSAGADTVPARSRSLDPGPAPTLSRSSSAAPVSVSPDEKPTTFRASLDHGVHGAAIVAGVPDSPAFDLRWRWSGLDLDRLVHVAGEAGVQLPELFEITGSGEGSGTLRGSVAEPHVAGTVNLSSLNVTSIGVGQPRARSQSSPRGVERAQGAGRVSPESPREGTWSLREGASSIRFDWRGPKGRIDFAGIDASGSVTIDPLEAIPTTLSVSGSFDPFRGELHIEKSRIESPAMLRAEAQGRMRLWQDGSSSRETNARPADDAASSTTERASGTVKIDAAGLSRWKDVLRPLIGDPAPGYAVEGNVEGQVTGALAWDGTWKASGEASIRKSGFSSQDGSQVLQGLETRWALALSGDLSRSPLLMRATADVGGFELLWGSFYVAAGSLSSKLEVTAEVGAAPTTGSGAALSGDGASSVSTASTAWSFKGNAVWSYPDGPRAEATIETAPERPMSYAVRFDAPDLGTTVDRYLRGPLGDSLPVMKKVTAAGSLHLDGRGSLSNQLRTLDGRLTIAGMRLTGTGGLAEVQGLDLDLPVDLRWEQPAEERRDTGSKGASSQNAAPRITGEPREGRIRFVRLTVQGLEVPPLATGLRVRADSVSLEEELSVKLLDGALALHQMTLVDLLRPDRRLEAAVRLEGLSMEAATRAFGLPAIAGTLEGRFPRVRMTPGTLEVEGGGDVGAFGGRVRVGKISGEDILSRYPKLSFSAEFEGIDLGQVTRQFDFGEMTGIVRGRVTDCVLFGSVPVAFDALIETEERKGVPRTVNVKAIKNLTILGTGTTTNVFDRGIQKFFDKYTYDRIGIQVTLHDDQMLLRGLERSGTRELFVKGRLPFPINVVNAQPGVAVSFQDMVERLKSLDLEKASVQR